MLLCVDVTLRMTEITNSELSETKKNKYHTLSLISDDLMTDYYSPEDISKHNRDIQTHPIQEEEQQKMSERYSKSITTSFEWQAIQQSRKC